MAFAGYLDVNDLRKLTTAAVDADAFRLDRALISQGIPKPFFLALPLVPVPLDQFQLDLNAVNNVERMADGQVPLVQFLQNIAWQLRLRERREAEIFERYANTVDNRTRGVVGLPEPQTLPEVTQLEAIVGEDDMVDFAFLSQGQQAGKSVARVLVPRFDNGVAAQAAGGRPWVMSGTAWMIAPRLLVTNHHVVNARNAGETAASPQDLERQAAQMVVEFDFDTSDAQKVVVQAERLEHASAVLDYAILRLPAQSPRQPLRLARALTTVTAATYMSVNIIQHPQGRAKRVAFRNNLVTAADNETIRYFTDTDFGSSGSPVCDDTWRVVGLHRGAKYVQGVKYQGKDAAYVNFGTQVVALLEDLRQEKAPLHGEIANAQD